MNSDDGGDYGFDEDGSDILDEDEDDNEHQQHRGKSNHGSTPADKKRKRASTTGSPAASSYTVRRRGRGASVLNAALFCHFIILEDRWQAKTSGNFSNHKICLCIYCQREFDSRIEALERSNQFDQIPLLPKPKRIKKCGRDCANHLLHCQAYSRAKMDGTAVEAQAEDIQVMLDHSKSSDSTPHPKAVAIVAGLKNVELVGTDNVVAKFPAASQQQQRQQQQSLSGAIKSESRASIGATATEASQKANKSGAQAASTSTFARKDIPDVEAMHQMLLELFVEQGLSFNLVEKPAFVRFCESLRPGSSRFLPSKLALGTTLLSHAAESASRSIYAMIEEQKRRGHRASLIVDGYSTSTKFFPDATLRMGKAVFPWSALVRHPMTSWVLHPVVVARAWETLLFENLRGTKQSIQFSYVCCDDSGPSSHARRIMAYRYPFLIFNRSWPHQINRILKIMWTLPRMTEAAKMAVKAANALKSVRLQARLKQFADRFYGSRPKKIYALGRMSWAGTQATMASQLRIREACRAFAISFENSPTFPEALKPWKSPEFWFELEDAEQMLRPLCDASILFQREKSSMADVVYFVLFMCQSLEPFCESHPEASVVQREVKVRWRREEHPLFFLAFCLHPLYHRIAVDMLTDSLQKKGNWANNRNPITAARLARAAVFYYCKFELYSSDAAVAQARELKQLNRQVRQYLSPRGIDLTMFRDDKDDPVEWWYLNSDEYPEIARLAQFLLDAPVQASTCDRLFGDYFRSRPNERLRAVKGTVFKTMQVKNALKRKYPDDSNVSMDDKAKAQLVDPTHYERVDMEPHTPEDGMGGGENENDEEGQEDDGDMDPISHFSQVLATIEAPELEEDFNEADDMSATVTTAALDLDRDGDSMVDDEGEEDEVERRHENLESLENRQVDNLPAEDDIYFHSKKYVRNDKYSLSELTSYISDQSLVALHWPKTAAVVKSSAMQD